MKHAYRTEADLCDAFTAAARSEGFLVHPECDGWDLLLVAPNGEQCGIEAKLRANLDVLIQALKHGHLDTRGPDFHAVLVPFAMRDYRHIARCLGITVIMAYKHGPEFFEEPSFEGIARQIESAERWYHDEPCWAPAVEVPGMQGGKPGPVQLTPWKISAIRLCLLLRERGYLTAADFRAASVDMNFWTQRRPVLLRSVPGEGRKRHYIDAGSGQLPDERWPEIAAALAAGGERHGEDVERQET